MHLKLILSRPVYIQCANFWFLKGQILIFFFLFYYCHIGHETNSYCLLYWQGPSPLTVFVLEDLLVRKYPNGGMFGTGFALSSASSFKTVLSVVVNEKHLGTIKEGKSFILLKFATLQDGTVKIGQNTVVSIILFQCV